MKMTIKYGTSRDDPPDTCRRVHAHLTDGAEEALVEGLSRLQDGVGPHDVRQEVEILRRAGPHWDTQVTDGRIVG